MAKGQAGQAASHSHVGRQAGNAKVYAHVEPAQVQQNSSGWEGQLVGMLALQQGGRPRHRPRTQHGGDSAL